MILFDVGPRHALRPAVERHIRDIYRSAYDARVSQFAARLIAAVGPDGQICCAAGERRAADRFHSECYLDRPAEQAVAAALARPVDRSELFEFTTLACMQPGEALGFVSRVVDQARAAGCHIALFTGTAPLRRLLARAGLTVIPVAAADRSRIANPGDWGRYYDAGPLVCIAPDLETLPATLRAPCFATRGRADGDTRPVTRHA